MEFKEWFCLKDRDSFTINPKVNPDDARFYFARDEIKNRVIKQIKRSFVEPGVPKMLLHGSYGSGKTQLLYFLEYQLDAKGIDFHKLKTKIVHLNIEMKSKSDHRDWHLQLMESLGKETVTKWVENISRKSSNLDSDLKTIFRDNNLIEGIKKLLIGGVDLLTWRWLCGQELTAKELEQLKVTRNLGQIGAGDMVSALCGLGRLAEANGEKLLFMMDEAERFTSVKMGDEIGYLRDYLRELSEDSNKNVGFIIAGTAITFDEMGALFNYEAVVNRIGRNNIIDIPSLPAVKEIKEFITELLSELIDKTKAESKIQEESLKTSLTTYPFSSDSLDLLCEFAYQDPQKALPRNIIKAINECAIYAWDEKKPIIDENVVNEIAPIVFG